MLTKVDRFFFNSVYARLALVTHAGLDHATLAVLKRFGAVRGAALLVRALENAELRVGLSWRNLKVVAGEDALPGEWAVLYLGGKGQRYPEQVNFVSQKGNPQPKPPGVRGLIVLDGTWSQAKALWWRNSWLLKLKRVVLQPELRSRYGNLRKEPRPDALSTIESCALALGKMDSRGEDLQRHLEDAFQKMLNEFKARSSKARPEGP